MVHVTLANEVPEKGTGKAEKEELVAVLLVEEESSNGTAEAAAAADVAGEADDDGEEADMIDADGCAFDSSPQTFFCQYNRKGRRSVSAMVSRFLCFWS